MIIIKFSRLIYDNAYFGIWKDDSFSHVVWIFHILMYMVLWMDSQISRLHWSLETAPLMFDELAVSDENFQTHKLQWSQGIWRSIHRNIYSQTPIYRKSHVGKNPLTKLWKKFRKKPPLFHDNVRVLAYSIRWFNRFNLFFNVQFKENPKSTHADLAYFLVCSFQTWEKSSEK